MTLDEARATIGRRVIYTPPGQPTVKEVGVITGVSATYVFVRYGTNQTSAGTCPEHLTLEFG